jgi:hypothetical protein
MFAIWQHHVTGAFTVIGNLGTTALGGTENFTCVNGILNGTWTMTPTGSPPSGWIVELNNAHCYGTCYYTFGAYCLGGGVWSEAFIMDQQCYGSPPGPLNTWTDYGGFAQYIMQGAACPVYCACTTPPGTPPDPNTVLDPCV